MIAGKIKNSRKKLTRVDAEGIAPIGIASLLLVVFFGGYLVMGLEILAFRIVQIYFGTSIYSTGAVLGIVLSALTLGYWLGGTMSVRFKPTGIQAIALFIAGLWILGLAGVPKNPAEFLQFRENPRVETQYSLQPPWKTVPTWILDHPVSESIEFRMRWDPLAGSIILFAVPSFLLAMVGPCAIRALTRKAKEAGRVSGWVFALGSLGSIAGVLVTSFWLIAVLGLGANLRLIGLVSIIISILAVSVKAGDSHREDQP
jgi:predicted membrane-bound spermidine synthase